MKHIKLFEHFLVEATLRSGGKYKVEIQDPEKKWNRAMLSRAETLATLFEHSLKLKVKDLVVDAGTPNVTQIFIRFENGLEFIITDRDNNLGAKSTRGKHKEWVDEFIQTMQDEGYEVNRFSTYDNSRVEVMASENDLRNIKFYKKVYDALHSAIVNANTRKR